MDPAVQRNGKMTSCLMEIASSMRLSLILKLSFIFGTYLVGQLLRKVHAFLSSSSNASEIRIPDVFTYYVRAPFQEISSKD